MDGLISEIIRDHSGELRGESGYLRQCNYLQSI
jgi:hypothetical protein